MKIKEAKRECWSKWIEEEEKVCDCVRACRNPFALRETCGKLVTEAGEEVESDAE